MTHAHPAGRGYTWAWDDEALTRVLDALPPGERFAVLARGPALEGALDACRRLGLECERVPCTSAPPSRWVPGICRSIAPDAAVVYCDRGVRAWTTRVEEQARRAAIPYPGVFHAEGASICAYRLAAPRAAVTLDPGAVVWALVRAPGGAAGVP